MSRKKATKHKVNKKISAKRSAKISFLTSAESMLKEFKTMPAKLTVQLRQDLRLLKQQETALKISLKKAQLREKAAKSKQADLISTLKTRYSATTKKQLNAAKKSFGQIAQIVAKLTTQLDNIKNEAHTLAQHQAKLAALHKNIAEFEKNWSNKSTNTPVLSNSKKIVKKSARKQIAIAPETLSHDYLIQEQAAIAATSQSVDLVS